MSLPVRIVDVAPRDGLQNEPVVLAAPQKAELVRRLAEAGVPQIEVGSFVRPDRVPQMAGTEEVVRQLPGRPDDPRFTALVPNERGYERAVECGLRHLRFVLAASESMNLRNFGMEVQRSLEQARGLLRRAPGDGVRLAVTVAVAFGCPFEGRVAPERVVALAQKLAEWGACEVMVADTVGMAVPPQVGRLVEQVCRAVEPVPVGVHLHNTRNTGYANAFAALQAGAVILDASLGGIGGCPFAPRATGNIATEDLVHMLERSGVATGVDLGRLLEAVGWLEQVLGRPVPGMLARAGPVPEEVYR
ncbi:MAG TPA: hydroxymethylglutaryl-CoA lyase [Limnochordales bacterium]